jgi:hypothetical protein
MSSIIITKFNGYQVHSNAVLPNKFNKYIPRDICIILKRHIKQHYFKIEIKKEWGITITKLYDHVLRGDLVAFGLYVPKHSNKYIIMSTIGHHRCFNFERYYHIYKPITKRLDAFLVFPFTMILNVNISECNKCGHISVCKIGETSNCFNCEIPTYDIHPKEFEFGDLLLKFEDLGCFKHITKEGGPLRKDSCRLCLLNKRHTNCTINKFHKKLNELRQKIQSE